MTPSQRVVHALRAAANAIEAGDETKCHYEADGPSYSADFTSAEEAREQMEEWLAANRGDDFLSDTSWGVFVPIEVVNGDFTMLVDAWPWPPPKLVRVGDGYRYEVWTICGRECTISHDEVSSAPGFIRIFVGGREAWSHECGTKSFSHAEAARLFDAQLRGEVSA